MEKWQKDLISMIEAVADEVEQFFLGINDMVDAFFEITEEVTEEVQSTLAADIDAFTTLHEQFLQDLTEPILGIYWEDISEDLDPGFPYKVEATLEKNIACIGCSNYHGQVYGGNLLVCGMHPHGSDDGNCPDWEKEID
ncbi:hypothetical protein RI030_07470 [Aphanizomenon flos-aquae NRERC-008]|jgi:hypothetical protein|uniref:Uncharacterized protein n=2 Tax=Aphanizomenon flos-aquae TaxID=1176 RepID=A0A1B7X294_APHFL|nr:MULTISPECIES: hypothetical protein [Aphanizomenon]MBD1217595.1 hypothetical protein [Aphanizomenon flos-aquae Clear-A1]MCE2905713.1 hypothetical protein [Anabaena sp. CoA2_C59]MDJ0504212.1 hypothetical protein [Nostocales cyanobacterium LE14-WE12]NTW20776.1 hypothetical protein [Nostocales cyanobacterium W4_Combined_metabat2_030]OBQ22047.1 MAG: hypothetical protein AN488_09215 [Anabaena sp. WA113]OBQ43495.1 MAG: hypothetical protein AN484_12195 [Aphanizomenon flos-aquae WA102]QSV67106.1 M